jgi:hypothetical protein
MLMLARILDPSLTQKKNVFNIGLINGGRWFKIQPEPERTCSISRRLLLDISSTFRWEKLRFSWASAVSEKLARIHAV